MRTTAAILAGLAANACFLCSARPAAPDAAIEEIRFKIEETGGRFFFGTAGDVPASGAGK